MYDFLYEDSIVFLHAFNLPCYYHRVWQGGGGQGYTLTPSPHSFIFRCNSVEGEYLQELQMSKP